MACMTGLPSLYIEMLQIMDFLRFDDLSLVFAYLEVGFSQAIGSFKYFSGIFIVIPVLTFYLPHSHGDNPSSNERTIGSTLTL